MSLRLLDDWQVVANCMAGTPNEENQSAQTDTGAELMITEYPQLCLIGGDVSERVLPINI